MCFANSIRTQRNTVRKRIMRLSVYVFTCTELNNQFRTSKHVIYSRTYTYYSRMKMKDVYKRKAHRVWTCANIVTYLDTDGFVLCFVYQLQLSFSLNPIHSVIKDVTCGERVLVLYVYGYRAKTTKLRMQRQFSDSQIVYTNERGLDFVRELSKQVLEYYTRKYNYIFFI